ncbi:hypothetical protein BGX34_001727 [Mortierella sp. NVP85]|nr:hypothetical protein BGX34_001727 [Mortierella sp. NVP85]
MNKASTNNPRPSVQFNEDETRGRHTATIPLTMTATTESSKSHRSSISFTAIADRIRRTRTRSSSRSKSRSSVDAPSDDEDNKYSKRRSSKIRGEYADVARAQLAYMDKLRSYQAQNNITHNIHGLPIRKPEEHRFSWANMLGWGKPLLAR